MRLLLAALALWTAAAPAGAQGLSTAPGRGGGGGADRGLAAGGREPARRGSRSAWRPAGTPTGARRGAPASRRPFDWTGSGNLASAATEWPRPQLFASFGVTSIGYAGRVVLPVRLMPSDPAAPLDLALRLDFGVCADICVPAEARVAARIAPDAPAEGRARIEAALAARAESAAEAGVARVTCALKPDGRGFAVTAEITFAAEPRPGRWRCWSRGSPTSGSATPRAAPRGARSSPAPRSRPPVAAGPVLERRALRLTVLDDRRAVDIRGCEAPG